MSTIRAIAVIPARFGSSRFPGKPLADQTGKPLIQHVVEQVRHAKRIAQVIVATDDHRIADACGRFGCQVVMTRSDHPNGTCRIAEVVAGLAKHTPEPPEVIVNVQGDEPQIEPGVIDQLVDGLLADPDAPMATLASPFVSDEDPHEPNIVKIVVAKIDGRFRAMYFSRSMIPYDRGHAPAGKGFAPLKHPGLYAYRRDFLLKYVQLLPTPLEQTEQLEQLRALEHGYPIAVVYTHVQHHGIDTPEQYQAFVHQYRGG